MGAQQRITVKNQSYYYQAKRHWLDSETYAFNHATSTIDRDRFFVIAQSACGRQQHRPHLESSLFGMENRFAAQLQVSRNEITFTQEGNPNAYPFDTVSVINPTPGVYGGIEPDIRNSHLNTSRHRSKTVSSSRRCSR